MEDISKYAHSPAHLAVACKDHIALRRIVAALPPLPKAGEITTEEESIASEHTADIVSATIDRRDVPNRETPLHLAVRLRDQISVEILMSAGADWSLQNEQGWSALQEAVCTREDSLAMIIARHYQPLAWAKWCRRLPRIVSSISRIRDFYMEITFHFESSVIPFIGRIAPSDTYRIWKRGPNIRADMTLAGFDGLRIQRSAQTFLFLGEGLSSDGGNLPLAPGSLIVFTHKEKEITNALEGAGARPTEAEVAREVALMSQTNMYRPGIDVTQAELIPHLNWRRQERTEMVGHWKTKVYDMLHVVVSVKSRRVPGAMTDEELFAVENDERMGNGGTHDELDDVLTAEERKQLDSALQMENAVGFDDDDERMAFENSVHCEYNGASNERKSRFSWNNNKKAMKNRGEEGGNIAAPNKSLKLANENGGQKSELVETANARKGKEKSSAKKKKNVTTSDSTKHGSEYKKGLRPVLWLTPDFPLHTEELLPLFDVLANKVKAVRRLRELLTTKFPQGTFPVKVAIPLVPTIRVVITFTKFEELQPAEEFATPPSSPTNLPESRRREAETSSSWYSWMRGSRGGQSGDDSEGRRSWKEEADPFLIPSDYSWVDANEKNRRMKAKKAKAKTKKAGNRRGAKSAESQQPLDGLEE